MGVILISDNVPEARKLRLSENGEILMKAYIWEGNKFGDYCGRDGFLLVVANSEEEARDILREFANGVPELIPDVDVKDYPEHKWWEGRLPESARRQQVNEERIAQYQLSFNLYPPYSLEPPGNFVGQRSEWGWNYILSSPPARILDLDRLIIAHYGFEE